METVTSFQSYQRREQSEELKAEDHRYSDKSKRWYHDRDTE